MPLGIDAWWMDASNPTSETVPTFNTARTLSPRQPSAPRRNTSTLMRLMNADAIYNGQRGENHDNRVFLLTRSGFAGQQRYSTATWSGDIATRWEDMKAQISAGLNFAISGVPWWTMDIGGFCVEDRYVKAAAENLKTGAENSRHEGMARTEHALVSVRGFLPRSSVHTDNGPTAKSSTSPRRTIRPTSRWSTTPTCATTSCLTSTPWPA